MDISNLNLVHLNVLVMSRGGEGVRFDTTKEFGQK